MEGHLPVLYGQRPAVVHRLAHMKHRAVGLKARRIDAIRQCGGRRDLTLRCHRRRLLLCRRLAARGAALGRLRSTAAHE